MTGLIIGTDETNIIIRTLFQHKIEVSRLVLHSSLSPRIGDTVGFSFSNRNVSSVCIVGQKVPQNSGKIQIKHRAVALCRRFLNYISEEIVEEVRGTIKSASFKHMTHAPSVFHLYNKFALCMVAMMFVSLYLPSLLGFGDNLSYVELVNGGTTQIVFLLLTGASLLLGFPHLITRALTFVCLISIGLLISDGIVFVSEADSSSLFLVGELNIFEKILKSADVGCYSLIVSSLLLAITQVVPGYEANTKLGPDAEEIV